MAFEFDNGDTELLLLGNKSYRPKSFTLKEIIDLGYKDGLYEEGIKESEVKFKVNITTQNARTNNGGSYLKYHPFGQIVIWKKDGTSVSVFTMDYNNVYLNNNNFSDEIPNVRFVRDIDGYRYEIIGTKGFNTTVKETNTKPCASFGPPMSTGGTYPQCFENFTVNTNTDPNNFYIQTDNPNVKAIAIMFFCPPAWSSGYYLYTANKLIVNDETIYDYETMADYVKNEYRSVLGQNDKLLPRFVIVKNDDDTYTTYKSWMYYLNYPNEINRDLFLIGETYFTIKSVTLDELIKNKRTDGLFDDAAGYTFNLDIKITQMWKTFNSGEIMPCGALVWDKANNPLLPYNRVGFISTVPVVELIDATFTDSNTTPMRINLKYDRLPNGNNNQRTMGGAFLKNIQTTNGWTAAGKIVPGAAMIVTGGEGNDLNINYKFYSDEFKALAIDTVSTYDIKYNGINNGQNRHCGRVESITHNTLLHTASSNALWVERYTRTVNGKIYGARCIFTKDKAFMCFTNITDAKNLVVDPNCYIYHAMTDEMTLYSINEMEDLAKKGKIVNGCYYYDVVNISNFSCKLTKTFDTDNEFIGYKKLFIINKTTNKVITSFKHVAGDTLIGKDDHLYELSTQSEFLNDTSFLKSVNTADGITMNDSQPFDFTVKSSNPNAKRMAIIPWYDEENIAGKLEIGGKVVYNHATMESYKNNEFKIVNGRKYGCVYLYDIETKVIKKAWVLITADGISNNFYIVYAGDTMGVTSIDDIFKLSRSDGTSPDEYVFTKYSGFSVQIISGGQYGGATYRMYPVINEKVYYLYSGAVVNTQDGVIEDCIFRYSGRNVRTTEDLWNFIQACNTTTSANTFSEGDESDQFIASVKYEGRYVNSSLYQPITIFRYPGVTGSHTYFMGRSSGIKRQVTVTVVDNTIKGYENKIAIIDSVILIPYHAGNTSSRCATKFDYFGYVGDDVIRGVTINASSYRGWIMSETFEEGVEEILKPST